MLVNSKIKTATLLVIALFLVGANSYSQFIASKGTSTGYYSAHDESYFGYLFYPDNFCVYVTLGHFGNSWTFGRYSLQHDTIIVTPFSAKFQKDVNYFSQVDTLIFKNDSCLVSKAP